MAYAFNDDKTKHSIDGLESTVADNVSRIGVAESRIDNIVAQPSVSNGTKITRTVLFSSEFPVLDQSGSAQAISADIQSFDEVEITYQSFGKTGTLRAAGSDIPAWEAPSGTSSTAFHWDGFEALIGDALSPSQHCGIKKATFFLGRVSATSIKWTAYGWTWSGISSDNGSTLTTLDTETNGITKIVGITYADAGTSKDAELVDIRVGADGTTYSTAGDAVREQIETLGAAIPQVDDTLTQTGEAADAKATGDEISNLNNHLSGISNVTASALDVTWSLGSIFNGADSVASTRARCGFITLKKGEALIVQHGSYYWQYVKYKTDGTYLENSSAWNQTDGTIQNSDEDYLYRFVLRNPAGSADVVVADIDVGLKKTSVIVQTVNKNTSDISAIDQSTKGALFNMEFVIPPVVNICGGIEQNFYYQNIIKGFNTKKAYCITTSARTTNYDYFARLSPAESASLSNYGFKFRFYPYNSDYYISSDTLSYNVVPKTSGDGLTKKVMLIGDSLTYNAPLSKHLVDDLFADDVMSIELVGTLGTAPYLREGRSGWSAHDYVSGADNDDSFSNAFWNPDTSAFDFSYYMENNGFDGVDYVFINLGTNTDGYDGAGIATDIETMVTSIHAYDSTIRVGVWTPPPRALMGDGFLTDNDTTLNKVKGIINQFSGRTSERIYVVPVTLNVDPYHDFPYETVNVSNRNSNFTMVVSTDRTHPADCGYYKMADVIYSYIKYFGSLDA